jgi:2-C-methyl-D-erythritol 4-phosphate cytidylyltransferase
VNSAAVGRTVAVILAAGRGVRLGGGALNKALVHLGGQPILVRATRPFASHPAIEEVIVVAAQEEMRACAEELSRAGMPDVAVIPGGESRHASEWLAIHALGPRIERGGIDLIVIHDAARPLYQGEGLEDLLAAARESGGAIFAIPIDPEDDVVRIVDGEPPVPVSTDDLWRAQTPQAFQARLLLEAFHRAESEGFEGSDTSSTVERLGTAVRVVPGHLTNVKITYPADLALAESLMDRERGPD